jgi:hypothetical protein
MLLPAAIRRVLDAFPSAGHAADFDAFFECLQSYETLAEIAAIATHSPSRTIEISPLSYLLFALEAHLNEFYIFTERLKTWLVRLQRRYRKSNDFSAINSMLAKALARIDAEAEPIRTIRGRHVHTERHFGRAHPLRRMSLHSAAPDYLAVSRREWKRIKVHELREIRRRNHTALRLMKQACEAVAQTFIGPDGTWIVP